MFTLPTLYKNKQRWDCQVIDYGAYSEITVIFGQDGGKLQTKVTTIDEGKNIGKTNETTHYDQAISEAKSKWLKQKDKLYTEDKGAASTVRETGFRPMLAQSYDKHAKKIVFPCYVQVKYDGLRNFATIDGLFSRQGKQYKVLQHIELRTKPIIEEIKNKFGFDIVLDGELYTHTEDFNSIVSGIKRDEENDLTEKIQYHVYDCCVADEEEWGFEDRFDFLTNYIYPLFDGKILVPVESVMIKSSAEIQPLHDKFVTDGYEGLMLRNIGGLYQPDKRSYDLQKVKMFDDEEFEIVDYEEDKNGHAVFHCITKEGYSFSVKPKGSHKHRTRLLEIADTLIGQQMNVRYFGLTTSDKPVPRFPVGRIKNYD